MKAKNIEAEVEKVEKVLIDSVPERTMAQVLNHIAMSVFTIMRRNNVIMTE